MDNLDWVHHDSKTFDEEKFMENTERNYIEKHTTHIKGYTQEYVDKLQKDMQKEITRLNKENNDLRELYQRTYKHLYEIGNEELARYFLAQIDECPTFYVEPIVDYYEESRRLNNIIKELEKDLEKEWNYYNQICFNTHAEFDDEEQVNRFWKEYGHKETIKYYLDKLNELKEGSDKE